MSWHYDPNDLEESDEAKIRDLLMGHKVVKVADDKLTLDDGTVLTIYPNEGCGGCSNGYYEIAELNDCDNIITNVTLNTREVETKHDEGTYSWSESTTVYEIFVYAENQPIKLLEVSGSDGNGYYGTGYRINVTRETAGV